MEKLKFDKILKNKSMLDVFNDAVVVLSNDKNIVYYNYQYLDLTGLTPRQLGHNKNCFECFHLDICRDKCIFDQCKKIKRPVQLREVDAKSRNGQRLSLWVSAFPLFGQHDTFEGALIILRNMTVEAGVQSKYKTLYEREKEAKVHLEEVVKERTKELKDANIQLKFINKKLEEFSIKDNLTGLYNYRYFSEKIVTLFDEAKSAKKTLSCLLIDVDFFKLVNDTCNHQFGDFVLYKLGLVFSSSLRKFDVLARYGGDEFIILLPGNNYREALFTARQINKKVKNENFSDGEFHKNVTVSIGISSYPYDRILTKEGLVKFSDAALYKAKGSGRNSVVCYKDMHKGPAKLR